MTGPDNAMGEESSQDPTRAPGTGLVIEGDPPDDADFDLVAVHGLHGTSVTSRWKEGSDEKTSIRRAFEAWTGKRARLMTYNYPPTTLTPRRIHMEASSLLEALQDLRTIKESTAEHSVGTERKEPEQGDPKEGGQQQGSPGQGDPGRDGPEQGALEKQALRPIIFISQDVGGLIVKVALTRATSLYRPFSEIAASVRGLIFVACPHRNDGPRPLEDQLLGILQGHLPAHLSVAAQAQGLAQTTEEINGEFFRAKSIVSTVLVNVFSVAEDSRYRVFDQHAVTTETPFETPIPSGAAHTELIESMLGGDKTATSVLGDTAVGRWSDPKPYTLRIMSCLQELFSLASPVFPLGGLSDAADAAVAALREELDEFNNARETRILHLRAKTVSESSLLATTLVRRLYAMGRASSPDLNHNPDSWAETVFNFEFQRRDSRFDSIRSMVATLLAQLFFNEMCSPHGSVENFLGVVAEHRGWTTEDLIVLWRLRRGANRLDGVVYVLGGLDQCDDESAHVFLRWLEFVAIRMEVPIKIVITTTSGLDSHVKEAFSSYSGRVYSVHNLSRLNASVSSRVSRSDIHLALLLQKQPRYDAIEPKLAHLLKGVSGNGGGAVLQVVLNWLAHTSLSLDDIERVIDKLDHDNLDSVVDVVLSLIPADRRLWSRRILSFLYASGRAPGVMELCTVSHIATNLPDDPRTTTCSAAVAKILCLKDELKQILSWLGGLLTVRNGEFHLSHPSLRDALRAQVASQIMRQHKDILDVCMAYLGQLVGLGLQDNVLDSLPYATDHWPRHYSILCGVERSSHSVGEIRIQARQLVTEEAFLEHYAATQQASSRPFAPLPGGTSPPGPLSVAAQFGLKDLVESLPSLDQDRRDGLVVAARNGHLGTVKLLLRPSRGDCAPEWESLVKSSQEAAVCGYNDVFDLLVEEMARRPTTRPPPSSLLFRATFLGLEDVVGTLLDLGVNVNSRDETRLKRTALHIAASLDRVAVLEVLLRRGSQATAEAGGSRGLHMASLCGSTRCARELLDADPSGSEVEASSRTPLVLAVEMGNVGVAEVLLEHDQRRGCSAEKVAPGYGNALSVAARFGYRRAADLLLRHGADPNRTRRLSSQWSALQLAVWGKHLEICHLLLESGADANDAAEHLAPLILAANRGNAAIVTLLLERGALVDALDSRTHQAALHMAAMGGHEEIIRILLEKGASIDARGKYEYTPLFLAAMYGHAGVAEVLAVADADVDARSGFRGRRPLHVSLDAPGVAQVLLKHGADANAEADDGTPLRLAAHFDKPEVAKLLLGNGARLKLDGEEREPLLATALWEGSPGVARALLEAGADASQIGGHLNAEKTVMEKSGAEALELLVEFWLNPSLRESSTFLNFIGGDTPVRSVQRLVRAGADPNREDEGGHTALCAAVISSNVDVARYLLGLEPVRRHGIKGHIKGHTSEFAGLLHHALRNSTVEMVRLLVDAGDDVNAIGDVYGGVVPAACYHTADADDKKKLETLRYLIDEVKADVNARGGALGHAMNVAASCCGPDVVRLLLEQGAELDVEDAHGRRPVHLACQNDLAVLETLAVPGEEFGKRDRLGRVPLHFAAVSGNVALVREVLERSRRLGVSVDEVDGHGWTALMWASRTTVAWPFKNVPPSENDREAIVRFLLDEGADQSVTGKADGGVWTPVEVAVFHGAGKGLIRLLSPGSGQDKGGDGARRRVGVLQNNVSCDSCVMMICGYFYRCKAPVTSDLCFKCYQSREELGLGSEWVRYGEETEEEGDDVAVNSPDVEGDSGGETDDEEYDEEIIIEEEEGG